MRADVHGRVGGEPPGRGQDEDGLIEIVRPDQARYRVNLPVRVPPRITVVRRQIREIRPFHPYLELVTAVTSGISENS